MPVVNEPGRESEQSEDDGPPVEALPTGATDRRQSGLRQGPSFMVEPERPATPAQDRARARQT